MNINSKNKIEISIKNNLLQFIKKLHYYSYEIEDDINFYIANQFVNGGILDGLITSLKLDNDDWHKIISSIRSLKRKRVKNNGVLFEYLAQEIIEKIFNVKRLLIYKELPDILQPPKGIDLIFTDENNDLYLFEVKSKTENKKIKLENKICEAFISLFCGKEIDNQHKCSISKKNLREKGFDEKAKIWSNINKLEDQYSNLCPLVDDEAIVLNICLISNGLEYDEETISDSIYKKLNDLIFQENLENVYVINVLNFELNSSFNIDDFYNYVELLANGKIGGDYNQ